MNNTAVRKQQIIDPGLELAAEIGFAAVNRAKIAAKVNLAEGTVSHRLGTMAQVRRSIMRAAIKNNVFVVIAQGLALNDPTAVKAPAEVRKRALAALL